VFASTPCHLIAGERSRDGWDVPAWAMLHCGGIELIPSTGHFMMREDSELFGATVARLLDANPSSEEATRRLRQRQDQGPNRHEARHRQAAPCLVTDSSRTERETE
jgi:hypothetical protein